MNLSSGISYLAIPGPSVMPERVLMAMHRSAPNIYEGELVNMVPDLVDRLKQVARTQHDVAIYVANGHGAWEAAISNTLSAGERAVALATGSFAHGWSEVAQRMGVEAEVLDFGQRSAVDPERLVERLRKDRDHAIKAILAVHTDTSTGIRNDIEAIRSAIDEAGHPALLMVDCIASLGCDRFEMDAWGVDVMVAGSQKGLMTPPGLGFVFFNERASQVRNGAGLVTYYWDWRTRVAPEIFYQYFAGTAPAHHLYGLHEALLMIEEEGLENIWARHAAIAEAVWASFDHWGKDGPLEVNAPDRSIRSHSVTALRTGSEKATALREWCEHRAGLTLGIGLGMAEKTTPEWHHFFRLGHMGHVNAQMILGALGTVEAGLKAVDLPHRPGGVLKASELIAARA